MILLKKFIRAGTGVLAGTGFAVLLSIVTLERAVAKPDIKGLRVRAVAFTTLPGWKRDDHAQAFAAFLRSCQKMGRRRDTLYKACQKAKRLPRNLSNIRARAFFESYFSPHQVKSSRRGLLTGYYEPEILGSRVRTSKFKVPIYRRPSDLVGLHERGMRRSARRSGLPRKLTYAKRTKAGLKPYMTREQIERGGLNGRKLEMLWLADPVDVFFLHIQGSGRIILPDGSTTRIGFDGKNGYDYSSVGRVLVREGILSSSQITLANVKAWLRKNPKMGRRAMWRNKSFIFFREIPALTGKLGPIGAQGIPLIGGRSLAVDRRHYRLGLPIYLSVPNLRKDGHRNLRRLMIAQDTGTAIKGARRGDIFWGSGDKALDIAARTHHKGEFFVLLPRRKPVAIKVSTLTPAKAPVGMRQNLRVRPVQTKTIRMQKKKIVKPRVPTFEAPGVHAFSRYKSKSH